MEDFGHRVHAEMRESAAAPWAAADWRTVREGIPGQVRFQVREAAYTSRDMAVEGDYSGASYLLAAGALGTRPVRVVGLNPASAQGDAAIVGLLERMGARVERGHEAVTVFPSTLTGMDADMADCPDLVPTVAVLALSATGPTVIRNVAHLQAKESDRLTAVAQEFARTGKGTIHATANTLTIVPEGGCSSTRSCEGACRNRYASATYHTHDDHRIAMALALFELDGAGLVLDNPACVSKSFPDFWNTWRQICPHSTAGGGI